MHIKRCTLNCANGIFLCEMVESVRGGSIIHGTYPFQFFLPYCIIDAYIFSLIWHQGLFSLLVATCMCVPSRLIVVSAQTVSVSVFWYKIDDICIFLYILNLKGHQNCMTDNKIRANLITKSVFYTIIFYVLLLPFIKVKSKLNQLHKQKSSCQNYEKALVLEFAIFAQT